MLVAIAVVLSGVFGVVSRVRWWLAFAPGAMLVGASFYAQSRSRPLPPQDPLPDFGPFLLLMAAAFALAVAAITLGFRYARLRLRRDLRVVQEQSL